MQLLFDHRQIVNSDLHKVYNGEIGEKFVYTDSVPPRKLTMMEQTHVENKYLEHKRLEKMILGQLIRLIQS